MRHALVVAALALVAGGAGCKKDKELAGVGKWHVTQTKLKDATGRCLPEKLADGRDGSYCFAQPQFGIKGMTSEVDLWFVGTEPESALQRIQLKVRGCNEEKLFSWMQTNFGAPYDKASASLNRWKNRNMYIAGRIPMEPELCLIDIFPLSEKAAFDLIGE